MLNIPKRKSTQQRKVDKENFMKALVEVAREQKSAEEQEKLRQEALECVIESVDELTQKEKQEWEALYRAIITQEEEERFKALKETASLGFTVIDKEEEEEEETSWEKVGECDEASHTNHLKKTSPRFFTPESTTQSTESKATTAASCAIQ
jgi:hypothetical protein